MNINTMHKNKVLFYSTLIILMVVTSVFVLFAGIVPNKSTKTTQAATPSTEYKSLSGFTPVGDLSLVDTGVANSESNPYMVSSVDDLRTIAYWVNGEFTQTEDLDKQNLYTRASYRLNNHLDLSAFPYWEAIGTATNPFLGNFDGNGKTIYGLTIIAPKYCADLSQYTDVDLNEEEDYFTYQGLFGYVKYANESGTEYKPHIQKLGLKDTIIKTDSYYVGSLVGYALGNFEVANSNLVLIEQCYNTGYVEGSNFVGGLVGSLEEGATLTNCYNAPSTPNLSRFGDSANPYNATFDVATNIRYGSAGGLVGSAAGNNAEVILSNSYNSAKVNVANSDIAISDTKLGGVVGFADLQISLYKKRVFALMSTLPENVDNVVGAFIDITEVNTTFLGSYGVGFDFTYVDSSADWNGEATTTWLKADNSNSGLPVLVNVPQLIKIDFDAYEITRETNAGINTDTFVKSILNENVFTNIAAESNEKVALVVDSNTVLIEQGQTPYIDSYAKQNTDEEKAYYFAGWTRQDYLKSYNTAIDSVEYGSEKYILFPYNDMTLTAKYLKRTFEVTLTASPVNQTSSMAMALNQEGQELQDVTSMTVTYFDELVLSVTPISGYKISNWLNATIDPQNTNMAILNVKDCVDSLYVIEEGVSNIPSRVPASAIIVPESYKVSLMTNTIDSVDFSNTIVTEFTSGDMASYKQVLMLGIDSANIPTNYLFSKWEMQIVTVGDSLVDANWQEISTRDDSFDFSVPDIEESQEIYIRAVFVEQTWTVTILNSEGGSASLFDTTDNQLSTNVFAFNKSFVVKMENVYGYHLAGVVINGTESSVPTNSSIATGYANAEWLTANSIKFTSTFEDITFVPVFEKNVYEVEIVLVNLENLTGGASIVDENLTNILGKVNYEYKAQFVINVNLDEGYELVSLVANGLEVLNNSTFEVVEISKIIATIKLIDLNVYTNFVYQDSTIYKVDQNCLTGAGEYNYGDNVNVAITLPEMFEVVYWTVNGETVNSILSTLTLNSINTSQNVAVVLAIKTALISFSQSGDDQSSAWFDIITSNNVTPFNNEVQPMELHYGDTIQFIVDSQYNANGIRASKYVFAYWKVNGTPASTEQTLSLKVKDKDLQVQAVFRPADLSVSIKSMLMDKTNSTLSASNEAGAVNGVELSTYPYLSILTANAVANEGYKFLGWYQEGEDENLLLSADASYQFTMDKTQNFMAVFVKTAKISLTNSNENAGTLNGAGIYEVGDNVTVMATAKDGFKFVAWYQNDVAISSSNEFSFNMPNRDVALIAEYEPIFTINYVSSDVNFGQVIGNTTGKYKENVTLEAISANNCSFIGWVIDDVVVSTATKLNITLNGDVEVRALFKKNFDWNIIIVLAGCLLFAVVLIAASSAYIKMKEAEPMPVRALINGKDDKDVLFKNYKRNAERDEIEPVPTRKSAKPNIQPIPVRKIVVAPSNHKGEEVKKQPKASEQKPTLSTDVNEE